MKGMIVKIIRAVKGEAAKAEGPNNRIPSQSNISLEQILHFTKLHPHRVWPYLIKVKSTDLTHANTKCFS